MADNSSGNKRVARAYTSWNGTAGAAQQQTILATNLKAVLGQGARCSPEDWKWAINTHRGLIK